MARAKSPLGPFEGDPENPILTAVPENRTITIAKLSQEITWNFEFNKTVRVGDEFTFNATSTSTTGVVYTSNNANATVSGNKITIVGEGNISITASQGGNTNWEAAQSITKTATAYQYNVSNLQATETGTEYVKLAWDAIDGADSYSIYENNNLLANGVQIEALSVEDNGAEIKFNVFVYNVQPGVTINYATGESSLTGEEKTEDEDLSKWLEEHTED